MKILAVGDLHGSDHWKTIDPKKHDKIIFMGDYIDSFVFTDTEIVHNLKEVIQFKQDNLEKVILLWGNHDYMYFRYPSQYYMCSGFRRTYQPEVTELFITNQELFQIAFQIDKYLFTHAGIVSTWFKKYKKTYDKFVTEFDCKSISEFLNMLPETSSEVILSDVGTPRGGWGVGGPIWADKSETMHSMLSGYHQIVGHTHIKKIEMHRGVKNTSMTYIDCLNPKDKEPFSLYELEI